MSDCSQLLTALKNGDHDRALAALYALDGSAQRLEGSQGPVVVSVFQRGQKLGTIRHRSHLILLM